MPNKKFNDSFPFQVYICNKELLKRNEGELGLATAFTNLHDAKKYIKDSESISGDKVVYKLRIHNGLGPYPATL